MENNQAKLMIALAKRLKSEKKVKAKIITTFTSAGILNKEQKFTKHYSNLEKAVELATSK